MAKLSREEGLRRIKLVASLLDYIPESGEFLWKHREGVSWFNTQFSGKKAGRKNAHGYMEIRHREENGKTCSIYVHRLVWFFEHRKYPEFEIDHINGVRHDNRIENLRDVTRAINSRNQKTSNWNQYGAAGVSFFKRDGNWRARIKVGGSEKHLGYFDNFDDAAKAAKEARLKQGFTERHIHGE